MPSTIEEKTPYTYRPTCNGDNVGSKAFDTIVGGTVAWNQLAKAFTPDNWEKQTGSTTVGFSDDVIIATLSDSSQPNVYTPAIKSKTSFDFKTNHKYLFSFDFMATKANITPYYRSDSFLSGGIYFARYISANVWQHISKISNCVTGGNVYGYFGAQYLTQVGFT